MFSLLNNNSYENNKEAWVLSKIAFHFKSTYLASSVKYRLRAVAWNCRWYQVITCAPSAPAVMRYWSSSSWMRTQINGGKRRSGGVWYWYTVEYNTLRNITRPSEHYNDVTLSTMASEITSLTIIYSSIYSGVVQRKHQSSALLAFVRETHRSPVNSPHKGPVTRKMFPFDDVIMERHQSSAPRPENEQVKADRQFWCVCNAFPWIIKFGELGSNALLK